MIVRSRRAGSTPLSFFLKGVLPLLVVILGLATGLWFFARRNVPDQDTYLSTRATSFTASAAPVAAPLSTAPLEGRPVTLYVGSRREAASLVTYKTSIEGVTGLRELVDRIVLALQGPFPDPNLMPTVPRQTRLISLHAAGRRLVVNMSREWVQSHVGGSQAARISVYSLVNTLVENDLGDEVQFLIQGRPEPGFSGHIDLSAPFRFEPALVSPGTTPEKAGAPAGTGQP